MKRLISRTATSPRKFSYSIPVKQRNQSQQEMYFTKTHEWVQLKAKESLVARVGLSDYRQSLNGDFTFFSVDEIEVHQEVKANDELCDVESCDSVPDVVLMPASGRILKVNTDLKCGPVMANRSAEHDGWIAEVALSNPEEITNLMGRTEYEMFCQIEQAKADGVFGQYATVMT